MSLGLPAGDHGAVLLLNSVPFDGSQESCRKRYTEDQLLRNQLQVKLSIEIKSFTQYALVKVSSDCVFLRNMQRNVEFCAGRLKIRQLSTLCEPDFSY